MARFRADGTKIYYKKRKKYRRKPGKRKTTVRKKLPPALHTGRGQEWPTYNEAKRMVQDRKIGSRGKYRDYLIVHKAFYLPVHPEVIYKDQWEGWPTFLNVNNGSFHSSYDPTVYLPFWEAAKLVHPLRIESSVKWAEYIRNHKLPDGVPKNPVYVYRDMWWKGVGWQEWLGRDVHSVLEAEKKVAESMVWCIVLRDDVQGIFEVMKVARRELDGIRDVIGKWVYESEYEGWLWDYLEMESDEWEGKGIRVTKNVYGLLGGLNHQLLIVK